MKILFCKWENFGSEDMAEAFESLGHTVIPFASSQEELLSDAASDKLEKAAKESVPDIFFSFNYFPNIAIKCKELGLDYYAWVYDNPAVSLYSYTVIFPTNHIFVFDSDTFLYFNSQGIKTIEFLPMAAAPERYDNLRLKAEQGALLKKYKADISFVGSLYTEKHCFFDRLKVSDYTNGYLRGIMEAQKKVYGDNFIQKSLTPEVINDMYKSLPMEPDEGSACTKEFLFAQYVINRQITREERTEVLTELGSRYKVDLYTPDSKKEIKGCINHGTADFYSELPLIFSESKINLNITLRSIVNGIPLRCFEIMGAGGFLLTNYQGDFASFFEAGIDYVYYDGTKDLLDKAEYYLKNEDERKQIAAAGLAKIKEAHTYRHRAEEMVNF